MARQSKSVSHENAWDQRVGIEQRENHAWDTMYSGENIRPYPSIPAAGSDLD